VEFLTSEVQGVVANDPSRRIIRGDEGITVNRAGGTVEPVTATFSSPSDVGGPATGNRRGFLGDAAPITITNRTFSAGFSNSQGFGFGFDNWSMNVGTHGAQVAEVLPN